MLYQVIAVVYFAVIRKRFCPKSSSPATRVWVAGLWLGLFVSNATIAYAQKDVVITTSGAKLVGKIVKVEKDVLTLSTDYSDSDFKIKWDKIASIQSDRQFLVETFDGQRVMGPLEPEAEKKGTTQVAGTSVKLPEVASVEPIERSFLSRFDAGFDVGYSITRANSAKQLSLGGNLVYRDEHNLDAAYFNAFRSTQSNAPKTERWEIGNDFRHLLTRNWYANTTQNFLSSDEQQLSLRTTIGGGIGRYLIRSSSQHLALGGGLAWTNENYTDPVVPTRNSAEAFVGTEFKTEKLKFADLLTRLTFYPSLTISGRYRANYALDLDFNLPGDWYYRIGFFDNFDSQPPEGLSRNDYGWSNSFGLKF
jgi:Protein of unknown function, DUF481